MNLVNIDENVANIVETSLFIVYDIKKRKSKDYKHVYAYHMCVNNIERGVEIFNKPKDYLAIISLILTGFIKVEDEIIDFREGIAPEKDSFERTQYYLALAYLITLDYLENGNLYKASLHALESKKFLFEEIDKPRDFYENFKISYSLLELFDKKVPEVLNIVYNSDNLVK